MQSPCIRVTQSDPPPKFEFLKVSNYLGEFRTEVDKARARFNLGIPDSYSFSWGNIGGIIDRQEDLVRYLNNRDTNLQVLITTQGERINDLQDLISRVSGDLTIVENKLSGFDDNESFLSLVERLVRAETNINLNTALILQLINGGVTPNPTPVYGYATEDWVRSWVQSLGYITSIDTSGYVTTAVFNELVNRVNSLTGRTLTRIELSHSSLSATVGDDPKSITVTAYYSDNTTSDITETVETVNSSNDSFARWTNHKVQIVGTGTATLTFTYGGFSATLIVTVTSSSPGLELTYYIGYATAQNLLDGNVVGNSLFAITTSNNTIELTGEGIKKYQGCDLGEGELLQGTKLFFCCLDTKNLSEWHEISQGEDEAMIFLTYVQGISLGNEHYNVYLLSPRTYDNLTYIFKIN